MGEIDVWKAVLVRQDVNHPWGLRLLGGADFGQPIRINKVAPGSPAAAIRLQVDDVVTEVEGQPTANMTHSQLLDAIGRQTGDSLWLTIERKARGPVPQGPEVGQTSDQLRQSLKNYESLDNMTGPQDRTTKVLPGATSFSQPIPAHPFNNVFSSSSIPAFAASEPETRTEGFYTAAGIQIPCQEPEYSPKEPAYSPRELPYSTREPAYSPTEQVYNPRDPAYSVPQEPRTSPQQLVDQSGPRYYPPSPKRTPYDFQTVQSRPFVEPANRRRPHLPSSQPTAVPQTQPLESEAGFEQTTQLRNDVNDVPQSRTFRILESIMSNEEPAAGALGLPPPRSATMERMKREGSSAAGASPRVKVLMSQKYNSPLGMYSAKNVIETFAVQAETALETLEKQNPPLPEYEPVYASRH